MEKLCYIVWKPEGASSEAFRDQLVGGTAAALLDAGARRLSILCQDEVTAQLGRARITKMDDPIAGMVSFWMDVSDDRVPMEALIGEVTGRASGYLVLESVPMRNTTHVAPSGERTPGTTLLTCIKRPVRLSYESWLDLWHGEHRATAVETQCTYLYIRNTVVRALTPDAPDWQGIVEEGFPTEAVTDPMLWYCADGSKEKLKENLGRMLDSCKAFLDLDAVESHPMSEYLLGTEGT